MNALPTLLLATSGIGALAAEGAALPAAHTNLQLEGWTVRVDGRLGSGDGAALGRHAVKLLTATLVCIAVVVPEPALAKCVPIPDAAKFLSPFENHRMPWGVLHEPAHAYHDQVPGFDNPRIRAAWRKSCDSGKHRSVLNSPGNTPAHFGLTKEREFFAEMTKSYSGSNDFYPFVTGEVITENPEMVALLRDLWGPLPQNDPSMPIGEPCMPHFTDRDGNIPVMDAGRERIFP